MFSIIPLTNYNIWDTLILSFANAFNFGKAKYLLFGKKVKYYV